MKKVMGIRGSDKHKRMWNKKKNGEMPYGIGCHNTNHKFWWECNECGEAWEGTPKSISIRKTDKCKKCTQTKPEDLWGQKFGKWNVIDRAQTKDGKGAWLCECECGTQRIIRGFEIKGLKQCAKCFAKDRMSFDIPIAGQFWRKIEYGAKKRKLEFDITPDYAYQVFLEQSKRCALSGDDLLICTGSCFWEKEGYKIENHASLDRIDSSMGYISGNIQWVRKDINMMKGSLSQDDFISLCQKVGKYMGGM